MNAKQIAEKFALRVSGTYAQRAAGPQDLLGWVLSEIDENFTAYSSISLSGWSKAEVAKEVAGLKREGKLIY